MRVRYLTFFALVVLLAMVLPLAAQDQENMPTTPVAPASPVVTGFAAQDSVFVPGEKKFNFGVNPVLLVPVGKEGLFLMEWELEYGIHREDGKTEREFEYGLEYLQFNQPFSRRFTGVFGKFLVPGMWNERLHPAWIKKTPDAPFTAGLLRASGTGFMLRGAVPLGTNVNLTYSPFFTAAISNKYFGSERMAGGRVGTFFKKEGLDIGFLATHSLQGERATTYGADFTYQFRSRALDFRGEYYRGHDGSAYWVEAAKRFKGAPAKFLRRFEAAVRFEQAFVRPDEHADEGEEMEESAHADNEEMPEIEEGSAEDGDHHGGFPERNANRLVGTVNYYLRDGFKLYASYGREIAPGTGISKNTWGFGLAFRF